MAQMNVEQFASELGVLPAVLLEQLRAAGVSKRQTEDSLTETDKTQLLEYLRRIHGAKDEKGKISLPRRQTSEIKKADSTGKPRSIQVEVRKKRVLVRSDLSDKVAAVVRKPEPSPAQAPASVAPVLDAAQLALRQEEARKQAELIARQTAELREKKLRQKPAGAEVKESEPASSTAVPPSPAAPAEAAAGAAVPPAETT